MLGAFLDLFLSNPATEIGDSTETLSLFIQISKDKVGIQWLVLDIFLHWKNDPTSTV